MSTLFEATSIGRLTLPNRLVRSATWMAMAAPDGSCTDRLLDYYEHLAGGGLGLIITGYAFVSREGQSPEGQIGIHDDAMLPGLRELARRCHDRDTPVVVQIAHCGNQSRRENNGGLPILGPSATVDEEGRQVAREMTEDEIRRIIADFGLAAARAREAGFDGVQLHYAHGYLGNQFMSPRHNHRDDGWGGSLDNRSRFAREVYASVRAAVGPEYPVIAKMNLEDYCESGLTAADGIETAVELGEMGLDALEISGGSRDSGELGPARRHIRTVDDEAYFLANATALKERTTMPLILVGGLRTPDLMEKIHAEHGIDFFSMSRPLIREPHLVRLWREGRDEAAGCISCSGCFLSVKKGRGIFCIRAAGRDGEAQQ